MKTEINEEKQHKEIVDGVCVEVNAVGCNPKAS